MKKVENTTDDTTPGVQPVYWVVLGVAVLALVGYLAFSFLEGAQSSEALVSRALTAEDSKERIRAVAGLLSIGDREVLKTQLRRLAQESQDPEVLVIVYKNLLPLGDVDSRPLYFAAMNHSDQKVREAAYKEVLKMYTVLPGNLEYDVEDEPEQRAAVVHALQDELEKDKLRPLPGDPSAQKK